MTLTWWAITLIILASLTVGAGIVIIALMIALHKAFNY